MPLVFRILIVIIISILILNIQLRIVNRIFPQKEDKRKILWYTLLMGAIVASSLLVFVYFVQPQIWQFFHTNTITYSVYIAVVWWIIALLFASKKQRRWTFIVSTLTILAIVSGISELLFTWAWIWLVILKAAWEEVLKTANSQSLSSHGSFYKSDIILFSVLAWLGFSLFENLIYFVSMESVWQFFVRSITLSLLHGIFTWCIWYVLWKFTKTTYISYIVAYTLWIVLHTIYNISMATVPVIWGLFFTIGWYFLLSYLLYKSDRLYNNK